MRTRRQHPNPRSIHRQGQELTLLDIIASEAAALKLAVVAGDDADIAVTLANLAELVRQAQRQLLDDQTIEETAPGIWANNGVLTLPTHMRSTEETGR
ncbi:hypothetical protein [Actinomyces succiniciruminis]|uniref:Uncharacterized protein n=1 Tax=Actinomyces succiniciruminis TaxID=1522002 RepID=A0A1L7RMM0_9ACTO|nr:hypothetical protein [Actinomyces succiniciruminis]CED92439.1 Hypothetical protein AAM4_2607 [Actinomyces succiniciruminis]